VYIWKDFIPLLIPRKTFVKTYLLERLKKMFCLILLLLSNVNIHAQSPDEHQVKAAFIFNFTRFVTWPSTAFETPTSPFIIGVLGNNVGSYLEELIENEKVNNHPIQVRYLKDSKGAAGCHILFIEKFNSSVIVKIIGEVKGKPVLTISDAKDFMEESGMIKLYSENNKMRLEISQKKIEESQLQISARLLSLATLYKK